MIGYLPPELLTVRTTPDTVILTRDSRQIRFPRTDLPDLIDALTDIEEGNK
ncbi:hypothetical protein TPB0596_33800 [Tsukamurella pulmonis]|nr:hypothetical protein TPB0596_33800 [Tsukamurella pulmonis]